MATIKLSHGYNFGKETFTNEYKEICLENIELFFTIDEINNFLFNNIELDHTKFNSMIIAILDSSIYKNLAKYIGNFSKAGSNGNIYFGVSDDGIIEGIPYYGKLTTKVIRRMIDNVLSSDRSRGVKIDIITGNIEYDDNIVDWYYKNLRITITKLDIDESTIEDKYTQNMKKLRSLIAKNKIIEKEWHLYNIIYKKWHTIITRYSDRLNNFILDDSLYNEVISYIKINITDKDELKRILTFYYDKSNFDEFIKNNNKKVRTIYDNPSNPIIWLIRFKDSKTLYYKSLKPIKPRLRPVKNINLIFTKHISNIIAHLLKKSNPNFGLNLIKFHIPNLENSYLIYRDTIASKWKSRSRTLLSDGTPACF